MRPTKTLIKWLIFPFGLLISGNIAKAQQTTIVDSALLERVSVLEQQAASQRPGESHFMVAGLATFGFVANTTTTKSGGISQKAKTNSFPDVDHFEFSPLFLWRHGSKFLLEFEPSFDGTSVGVNWADVSYFVAPGLILPAGYLLRHLVLTANGWLPDGSISFQLTQRALLIIHLQQILGLRPKEVFLLGR
jgi:hypothetical protein